MGEVAGSIPAQDSPKAKGRAPVSSAKERPRPIPASSSGRTPDFGSGKSRSNRAAGAKKAPRRQQPKKAKRKTKLAALTATQREEHRKAQVKAAVERHRARKAAEAK